MWHRAKAPLVLPEELSQGATALSLSSRTVPEVVEGAGKCKEHVCTEPPGWRGWAEHPGVYCLGGPCPAGAGQGGFSLPRHGRGTEGQGAAILLQGALREAARMHFIRAGKQSCGCFWLQEPHERTRLDNHEERDGGEQASSPTPPLLPLPFLVMHFEWMRVGFKLWLWLRGNTG